MRETFDISYKENGNEYQVLDLCLPDNDMFDNKLKAVTFSFDDGNIDDIRLVEILNKYGLKGTFNLNSSKLTNREVWTYAERKQVKHINYTDFPNIYDGHEVACHGYTHPNYLELDYNTAYNDVFLDKKILECLYGYEIKGMAYPFGKYDEQIIEILEVLGIEYCRTVKSTFDFELPDNKLILNPTCHFKSQNIFELTEKFINMKPKEPKLFYIWGHSYELVTEDDWQKFEEVCKKLSEKSDIYYCTNIEMIRSVYK